MWQYVFGIVMFVTALFLILLVLVQRGRGGGLAGAFGGMGGQSAFGTKAGDMFTKVTIGTALAWIVICALAVRVLNSPQSTDLFGAGGGPPRPRLTEPLDTDDGKDAAKGGATGLLGQPGADRASDDAAAGADVTTPNGTDEAPAETPR